MWQIQTSTKLPLCNTFRISNIVGTGSSPQSHHKQRVTTTCPETSPEKPLFNLEQLRWLPVPSVFPPSSSPAKKRSLALLSSVSETTAQAVWHRDFSRPNTVNCVES